MAEGVDGRVVHIDSELEGYRGPHNLTTHTRVAPKKRSRTARLLCKVEIWTPTPAVSQGKTLPRYVPGDSEAVRGAASL